MARLVNGFPTWWESFKLTFISSAQNVWFRKASWVGLLVFAACVLILFPFALGTEWIAKQEVQAGSYWIAQEFVVALALLRMFAAESEFGIIDYWLTSASKRSAILLGKIAFTSFQLITLQVPIVIMWILFFNVPLNFLGTEPLSFLAINLLFAMGTSSLGVLIHCVTAKSVAREILVPILFYPMQTGILLGAVSLTLGTMGALSPSAWWTILITAPILFISLGFLLEDHLFQE